MEDECSPISWEFYYQEEGLEDLRHSFLYTTLELEATIASAKEEITRRECELIHLNDLLSGVMKERDEALAKCEKLMLEKLELQQDLQQKQQQLLQTHHNQNEDEVLQGGIISEKHSVSAASSDSEENSTPEGISLTPKSSGDRMPSPGGSSTLHSPPPPLQLALELAEKRPLPETGKLLKAVVEAGPLLQTLLLAGPLPQWQTPPPQLNSIEIPPVAISSPTPPDSLLPHQDSSKNFTVSNKRDLVHCPAGADCHVSKCRKVIQHLPATPTTATATHHSLPHPSFS